MKDINKLVEKVKSKDKKAFEELYRLTAAELYWYCKRLCRNDDEVRDLLQEVYFNAWQKINQYNGISFKSWLHSIAHNLWINSKKKKKEDLFSDDEFIDIADNESLRPDNISEKRIKHDEIIKLIDETLNDSQKLTVLMYYYDEKSVGEIAEELNCSETAAENRLYRARIKLQSKIKDKNLYSISLPLLFMFDSQKADFPDVLNIIRKSIMKKITLAGVEAKCFISILSTVALVGGTLAVSDIDLPSKEQPLIKAVDNSIITVSDASETEYTLTSSYEEIFTDFSVQPVSYIPKIESSISESSDEKNIAYQTEIPNAKTENESETEMLFSDEMTEESERKYRDLFGDASDEEIQEKIDVLIDMGREQGINEEILNFFDKPFLIDKNDTEESKEYSESEQ